MLLIVVKHLTFVDNKTRARPVGKTHFMIRTLAFVLSLFYFLSAEAQPKIKDKKYPSLLWEISGNGLKNMKTRAASLHGIFSVTSILNEGTTVLLSFNPSHNDGITERDYKK